MGALRWHCSAPVLDDPKGLCCKKGGYAADQASCKRSTKAIHPGSGIWLSSLPPVPLPRGGPGRASLIVLHPAAPNELKLTLPHERGHCGAPQDSRVLIERLA